MNLGNMPLARMQPSPHKIEDRPRLGELLHYVEELVKQGSQEHYRTLGLGYRARYTPVILALKAGAQTVTDIADCVQMTQGAISQTVGLLESDGIISRHSDDDGRKCRIRLTVTGQALVVQLERHRKATIVAIANLDKEIGYPLRQALEGAVHALERKGLSERISDAKGYLCSET